jgi:hypothetical protein
MQKWRDEFTEISKFKTHSEYVQSRIAMGTDLREYGSPEYLAMHVAAQKVLQIDKYPLEKLSLQSAIQGPFLYIDKVGWNSYEAVKFACSHPEFRKPFVKMRGPERNVLEQGLNGEFSNEKCRWV